MTRRRDTYSTPTSSAAKPSAMRARCRVASIFHASCYAELMTAADPKEYRAYVETWKRAAAR
ncbi:MAG: hypothetical protein WKF84_14740 [Pyrinomonadaceae bacterium]